MNPTQIVVDLAVRLSFDMLRYQPAARMPWTYSEEPKPGEPTHANVPTPEGRELGRHIARLADLAEAEQLAQFPGMKPRCHDCAARLGTDPNGCPETLMDLIKCAAEAVPFYCHVSGVKDGEPQRLCAGYVLMATPGVLPAGAIGAAARPPRTRRKP